MSEVYMCVKNVIERKEKSKKEKEKKEEVLRLQLKESLYFI